MSTVVEAIFDGSVFRPKGNVPLEPNTRVQITVKVDKDRSQNGESFLATARSLRLSGPQDFSERIDDYLYGGDDADAK